jgi:Dyp-type peroxidase family
MAIDLTEPLCWESATGDVETMLEELQANIVKAHVRDHLSVLFLHFGERGEAKSLLGELTDLMKSAKTHLEEVRDYKASRDSGEHTPGTPYVGVGLSATGYAQLGIDAKRPPDPAFRRGMTASATRSKLQDPTLSLREPAYRGDPEIHAVVTIGDESEYATATRRNDVLGLLPDSVTVLAEETGLSHVNENGDGIEHFGYVDGRSQPLFLTEDINKQRRKTDGTNAWDPACPLGQVIVSDPAAPNPSEHFGSYFVFRKLEQNVQRFKLEEDALAKKLGLEDEEAERAGALLVGRFEDGTPLTLQADAGAHSPVLNNFTYDSDEIGAKCPFHAHIRKMNPRGSGRLETEETERTHLMARRGQTYGTRADDPNADLPPSKRPTGGVGLLFMAFNVDIEQQFEFIQADCANNPGFPGVPHGTPEPGVDGVMGNGPRGPINSPLEWGGSDTRATRNIAPVVTLKGGEYFFMPSLAFLRSLSANRWPE